MPALVGTLPEFGRVTTVYRNDGGSFTDIDAGLSQVNFGSGVWGDYDNDGDVDILLTGLGDFGSVVTEVYRNDDGVFTNIDAGLAGVYNSSGIWVDHDNDGDLDVLLTGWDTGAGNSPTTLVYRNNGDDTFTDITAGLQDVYWSDAAWADYDNDGDLDILLTGQDSTSLRYTNLYRNDGGGTFMSFGAGSMAYSTRMVSSAAFGDLEGHVVGGGLPSEPFDHIVEDQHRHDRCLRLPMIW